MPVLRCRVCEAEYLARRHDQKYCSQCKRTAERRRQRKWEKDRYDAARAGMPRLGDLIRCAACSAETIRTAPLKRYCDQCAKFEIAKQCLKKKNAAAGIRGRMSMATCAHCSAQFMDAKSGKRKYCDRCKATQVSTKLSAKRRRKTDFAFAVGCNISSRMRRVLRSGKGGQSWAALLGYTPDQLVRHLERQFQPGMSWENRAAWHIDHVIPLASFKFSSPTDDEFRAAWALSNLRPIWREENQRKHAKRILLI